MGTLFFDKGGKNTQWGKHCCCCYVASVVSDSVQSHRRQPTRLPRPWDSPGKNAGVGCHFLLQCMQVKSKSEIADPMEFSLPGSSIRGIFQARVLEWGAIAFSRGKHSLFNKWCWESWTTCKRMKLKTIIVGNFNTPFTAMDKILQVEN